MKYEYKIFTKEMKENYKILVPNMLPIHFKILDKILKDYGFNIEFLEDDVSTIIDAGLKYSNNDICYPAMIVIGQFISALKSGKYDINKTALLMSQTGGGCRASNYIHLIRKALENSGFEEVPAIGLSLTGIEKHPGLKLSPSIILKAVYAVLYGDLIMCLYNKVKPYEINDGETDKILDEMIEYLNKNFSGIKYMNVSKISKIIIKAFDDIDINKKEKIKVGIVGEIYMKYSRMGNNHLEEFLVKEDAEVVQSGLMDFVNYCILNSIIDYKLYKRGFIKSKFAKVAYKFILRLQRKINSNIEKYSKFESPTDFEEVRKMADGYIGYGVKMGEGWLLVANMIELINIGANNIICAEPFGCLPNHIVGRGAIRKILEKNPNANIVVIDYDPSQSQINQENRIKLMLSNAKLNVYL
ncbi:2-hydroxyacyl-CoA dehydratase [Clostridium tertium]|jgi:predicted nucleotide-binding protein (sugar kinase/HSP70/actin superfamily)|uniref:2-hydroxyacyl-CoA dehydratase n=2 Tax=Clostridium TaxID=1485 RepID=A0A9X3XJX6_9CLOT|nr:MULTISPECIES: 2-hydroxyacyl-CoA dehydratase [Clostridium]MDB1923463.1 2-hydroxyacyl-CoA dehydratase [Clostridium tertium]MDB1927360.1 2-hydroxyacyl-CoA dehydratase [Clostridium tertium]MDB1930984.1 2-hydroxyacyl-CoA dehydratase [Clostridium tertium]MDB1934621.1 2-hydroxyacyl-CoA dehydratase [Clostridium tertium]MDB1937868.1 2-hydroxyacyl-CoA dehydratase [Clostridium tertium]